MIPQRFVTPHKRGSSRVSFWGLCRYNRLCGSGVAGSKVPLPSEGRPGRSFVIQLTRLNRRPLMVNSDLIEFIENAPDTVITLVTGEKLVVLETADQITDLIIMFRRRLLPTSFAVLPPVLDSPAAEPANEDGE